MIYHYEINETPIAWKRVAWNHGRSYDPQATDKERIRYILLSQRQHFIIKQPLELHLRFYLPVPPSYPTSKKQATLRGSHTTTPDVSNLIKFIEDAAIGIIFTDDKYITDICARKLYAHSGYTQIAIVTGDDHADNRSRRSQENNEPYQ